MRSAYANWSWDYPDALEWMNAAREKCAATGEMTLGIGAHSKPLITLGRHASHDEIRDAQYLAANNVQVYQIDRGGGATYHGPGQIVLYPIVDLQRLNISVPDFTTRLEQVMIDTLESFGIAAERITGEPGVFVGDAKIGAIGLRISNGIVTHGLSLNVNNRLDLYSRFRPCKKDDARVTSMEKVLECNIDISLVASKMTQESQFKVISC